MNHWSDFNDAASQAAFDLIPKGTLVKVRMTIKPGGYNDEAMGWNGGWATLAKSTGSIYLACEFVVLEGEHARRKLWSSIGLHSAKGAEWSNMGRSLVRAILNSARNVHPQDNSPQAQTARRIQGLEDLEGLVFAARVDIERDVNGESRNVIKQAIEPDHKDYSRLMDLPPKSGNGGGFSGGAPAAPMPTAPRNTSVAKPTWAQ